jgi:nucleotidyltransferase-like protein
MSSTADTAAAAPLPPAVEAYIADLLQTGARAHVPLVSVALFGSAAKGGFSNDVSDVDVLVVVADETSRETRHRLGGEIARLEMRHGLRAAADRAPTRVRTAVERAMGHGFSCFICTRRDLISGDVARVLDLRSIEALFVDRIVFASIVTSAVTVCGEDLLPLVRVPPIRLLDVFKALFGLLNQAALSTVAFLALADATKYAMGTLKHSLHSCYFCYHLRTGALDAEIEFFQGRMGTSRALVRLLALRREYRRSFAFVAGCVPAIVRLHLLTAWENRFPREVVR